MLLKFASQEFMLGHYYEVTLFITVFVSMLWHLQNSVVLVVSLVAILPLLYLFP